MRTDGSGPREDVGDYWSGRIHGGKAGDRRAGVVWHTQGSGKSFTMLFFAARVIRERTMENPTLVVLTDRNDLDDQLFGQFQRCADILGQTPVQAADREQLKEMLNRASGGVIFTTIQKFVPETKGSRFAPLTDRQNVVVIADEAHRTQYEFGSHVVKRKDGTSYIAHGLAVMQARRLHYGQPADENLHPDIDRLPAFGMAWPLPRSRAPSDGVIA